MAPAPCRIYLIVPPLPVESAAETLAAVLDVGPVGCVLLPAETVSASGEELTRRLISLTQKRGVAVLLEGDASEAKRLGADGVHLRQGETGAEAVARAKAVLGQDAPIGADCGLSRHEAMAHAEAGADYAGFSDAPNPQAPDDDHETGPITDMVSWWAELFEVPCVAWHRGGLDEARELALAGADFIAVNDIIWRTEEPPAAAMKSLFRVIAP
jgi:thiamine-phosphate pyrophosphorylase